jgi:quinoprotein glucose dehydrogenase
MFWVRISILLFAAAASRTVWDGVYTKDQAARGQSVYLEECAKCHGQNLLGGEAAPPVAGADFLKGWNGKTAADLYNMMIKSMPEDNPGGLATGQYADLVAYIFSANEFPAGDKELEHEASAMKEIRIEPRH